MPVTLSTGCRVLGWMRHGAATSSDIQRSTHFLPTARCDDELMRRAPTSFAVSRQAHGLQHDRPPQADVAAPTSLLASKEAPREEPLLFSTSTSYGNARHLSARREHAVPLRRPPSWSTTTQLSGFERASSRERLDAESFSWWDRLHAPEPVRNFAIAELHQRLRREAAFHIRQRVAGLPAFPRSDIDDLATQAADDALVSLLRKLEDYRGDSQFWTWARRFAQLEAPGSIRRRVGHDHVGISVDPERMLDTPAPGPSVPELAELHELVRITSELIARTLTPRQRCVMVALAIDGVPAHRLARELHTTPGAIYKTLHDARRKLRGQLVAC